MSDRRRTYCTLDHANKQRELAERSPYQFWLEQLRRESEGRLDEAGTEHGHRRVPRNGHDCRRGAGSRSRS
jgi:hypothetical protein